jgi:hypothetical protein
MDLIWEEETDKMPGSYWLVEGLIPAANDGVCLELIGEEGCCKSFVALDLALHIATGKDWLGHHTVAQGGVLYVCGERMSEIPKRQEAWADYHNGGKLPSKMLGFVGSFDLFSKKAVDDLIATVNDKFPTPPVLFIIDTLSSCQSGVDENSAGAVSLVRDGLKRIQNKYGATVLVVHHLNKAGTSSRGSNVLRGHVDGEYILRKSGLLLSMTASKMNKSDGVRLQLQLKKVDTTREPTLVITGARVIENLSHSGLTLIGDLAPDTEAVALNWADAIRGVKGDEEWTVADAVEITGLSRPTVYRRISEEGEGVVDNLTGGLYRLR